MKRRNDGVISVIQGKDRGGRRLRKQKEHQIIFNRYDVDRGGTVDAGELDVIFRDMKRVLPQEQINDLIFEYAVRGSVSVV